MPGSSTPTETVIPAGGEIRCHRCSYFCGETARPLTLVGVVKSHELRKLIAPPRDSWRCPNCGWHNVFAPAVEKDLTTPGVVR